VGALLMSGGGAMSERDEELGRIGKIGADWPSTRAPISAMHDQMIGLGMCSHRFGIPTVSTISCASTRGAPRHAVSRRAQSGRGRFSASTSGVTCCSTSSGVATLSSIAALSASTKNA
jgi:hypothetical protein